MTPKAGNSETPVKSCSLENFENQVSPPHGSNVSADDPQTSLAPTQRSPKDINGELVQGIRSLTMEMSAMRVEMSQFREQFERVLGAVDAANKRMDAMESRMAKLEERPSESPECVSDLMATVQQLKLDLNDREQDLLASDVEIGGLPEVKGENVIHLACLVAEKLGMKLEQTDVVSAERVGPPRQLVEGHGGECARPRLLAVRLARRALCENFLRSARVRRGADTDGFDIPGYPSRRFYVNERLSRTNRHLFYLARQEGSRLGWKFVWTREGRIYARRRPDSNAYRIKTESDIRKVFI
ncbi:uncharacterized protein LOC113235022 [Hyposmocoma kahamanoa]|uniref:uncharacterized protein LOC113235022 n=1 Tax=Hyposmocoma kahamanoa TaxID=1477025 RepID=UPI000E6D9D76|nr:uncharacterized protein LOC113235022 [Hyposmocoma kahamanoa]